MWCSSTRGECDSNSTHYVLPCGTVASLVGATAEVVAVAATEDVLAAFCAIRIDGGVLGVVGVSGVTLSSPAPEVLSSRLRISLRTQRAALASWCM
jgi:hypothetical protein